MPTSTRNSRTRTKLDWDQVSQRTSSHTEWLGSCGGSGARADFSGNNLTGANLAGLDLSGGLFSGACLATADLQNAKLINCDLKNVDFSRAKLDRTDLTASKVGGSLFHDASLAGADLSEVKGLLPSQLSGSDLTNAKLPSDVLAFPDLGYVTEIAKQAQTIFLTMLAASAYSWLTIATTTDVTLVSNVATTALPIISTAVALVLFYWAVPVILLGLYVYLHLYLQSMWEALSRLPAIFPDGRQLDETGYPWLLSSVVSVLSRKTRPVRDAAVRPTFAGLRWFLAILTAWMLIPGTILAVWLRLLPRHDIVGATMQLLVLATSVVLGMTFYRKAKRTLARKLRANMIAAIGWAAFSAVTFAGVLLPGLGIAALASWGIHRGGDSADLNIEQIFNRFTSANLREADLSTRSVAKLDSSPTPSSPSKNPNPHPPMTATNGFTQANSLGVPCPKPGAARMIEERRPTKGAQLGGLDLRRADARRAFLVNADLRQADLSDANLAEADFENADLSGASGMNANLAGANLRKAYLVGAVMPGSQLDFLLGEGTPADLTDAVATDGDFRGARFGHAQLINADFFGAALYGAEFSGADVECARFDNAVLRAADFGGAIHATQEQFAQTCGDLLTVPPKGITIPDCQSALSGSLQGPALPGAVTSENRSSSLVEEHQLLDQSVRNFIRDRLLTAFGLPPVLPEVDFSRTIMRGLIDPNASEDFNKFRLVALPFRNHIVQLNFERSRRADAVWLAGMLAMSGVTYYAVPGHASQITRQKGCCRVDVADPDFQAAANELAQVASKIGPFNVDLVAGAEEPAKVTMVFWLLARSTEQIETERYPHFFGTPEQQKQEALAEAREAQRAEIVATTHDIDASISAIGKLRKVNPAIDALASELSGAIVRIVFQDGRRRDIIGVAALLHAARIQFEATKIPEGNHLDSSTLARQHKIFPMQPYQHAAQVLAQTLSGRDSFSIGDVSPRSSADKSASGTPIAMAIWFLDRSDTGLTKRKTK